MPQKSRVGIADLRERLQAFQGKARIGSGDFRGELVATLGAVSLRQVLLGFREHRDPYGNPWAPVARGGSPLIDTGALRASATLDVTEDGFKVGMADRVAPYHQRGTKPRKRRQATGVRARAAARRQKRKLGPGGIRPRPMLPSTELGGLGPIWTGAFDRATRSVLRRFSEVS